MPTWIVDAFGRYGYVALFFGVLLENLGIPVPGETILLAAGFLAKRGVLRLSIVIPCAIVAAIAGDNLGYLIGRRGGRRFADKYGRYIGLTPKRLKAVEVYFHDHGPKTIFFARFISGIRVVAAIFAGVSGFRWPLFLAYNAAGAVAWATVIGTLGYLFGQSWSLLERGVGRAGLFLIAAVVCIVLIVLLKRHGPRITGALAEHLPGTMTLQEFWLIVTSLIAIGLFAKITEDVVMRESTAFDGTISAYVWSLHSTALDFIMRAANMIGGVGTTIAIVAAIVWRMLRHDRYGRNVLIALAVVTQAIDAVLKMSFQRTRPSPLHAMTDLYSGSFPSGHALNAIAIFGLIAVMIAHERRGSGPYLAAAVAILSLLIGLARIYLHLHWPTDVLAGYAAGLMLLTLGTFFIERHEGTTA